MKRWYKQDEQYLQLNNIVAFIHNWKMSESPMHVIYIYILMNIFIHCILMNIDEYCYIYWWIILKCITVYMHSTWIATRGIVAPSFFLAFEITPSDSFSYKTRLSRPLYF